MQAESQKDIAAEMARLGSSPDVERQLRDLPAEELRRRRAELGYGFYVLYQSRQRGLDPSQLEGHLWKQYKLIEELLGEEDRAPFPPYFQQRLMEADEPGVRELYAQLDRWNEA